MKSEKTTLLVSAAVIGASALLFNGITLAGTEAILRQTAPVPTQYASFASAAPETAQNHLPSGYETARYTVADLDWQAYQSQTPAETDLSKEDAAEIGAAALAEIFGLHLDGQVMELGYLPANDHFPRSQWYADVLVNGERSYSFSVDSLTGELLTIGRSRTLDVQVSTAFDQELDQNPQPYEELARKLAERYNVVHGEVSSVEYNGQGYSNNDPTISVDVMGENGEIALMTFSRYDQALLGISFNLEYKSALEYHEKMQEKMLKQVQEKQTGKQTGPRLNDENKTPSLQVLPVE